MYSVVDKCVFGKRGRICLIKSNVFLVYLYNIIKYLRKKCGIRKYEIDLLFLNKIVCFL